MELMILKYVCKFVVEIPEKLSVVLEDVNPLRPEESVVWEVGKKYNPVENCRMIDCVLKEGG